MKFLYFEAPMSEMSELIGEKSLCSFCQNKTKVFECEIVNSSNNQEKTEKGKGCYECLQKGKFGFFHVTELGYVDRQGLTPYFEENIKTRIFISNQGGEVTEKELEKTPHDKQTVSNESIAELRKTPTFSSWQEVDWRVHCNDFMAYKGHWQPIDFKEYSPTKNGKKLFLEVVHSDFHELWNSDNVIETGWDGGFVIFRCLHCGVLEGVFDFT